MSDPALLRAVEQALATVMEPELHRDIMSLGMVRDLRIDGDTVHLRYVLTTPACPLKDRITRDIETAVTGAVPGIAAVSIEWDANVTTSRGLPGLQQVAGVRNLIAISAGKGGVGKTTVSVNTAIALAQTGARVGLLDADVYGPNVPIMLGLHDQPARADDGRIRPLSVHGITVMSFGTIIKPGQPVIWRGPMLGKALREFLFEVAWGELDYLVIDMPPGTGDVQLSLAQSVPLTGAVIVTTPQDVSVADVSRGIAMFEQLRVPTLGVVENMSAFVCPHCGEATEIFGSGGADELAARYHVPVLGRIPLDPRVRLGGGDGQPLMISAPAGPIGRVFAGVASHIAAEISKENFKSATTPVMPAGPRLPVRGA